MSQLEARFVHQGFWINLEQGPVMGKTITTTTKTGTIVVALLALLASMAINKLWNISLFLHHQIRANGRQADGLSRQQQVLYRSLPTSSAMVADVIKLWWRWKKRTNKAFIRSMTPLILGAAFSAGVIVVGIFSSYVVDSTAIEVLVDSPFCGPLDFDPESEQFNKRIEVLKPWMREVGAAAHSHAKECSRNETSQLQRCAVFKQPYISFDVEHVQCPFARELCALQGSFPAIRTDSGFVDMKEGFGMNLAVKDGVKFRRINTCAVLSLEGRTSIVNISDWNDNTETRPMLPGEQTLVLHLGNLRFPGSRPSNATFIHSLLAASFSAPYNTDGLAKFADPIWDAKLSTLDPISGLQTDDADMMLIRILKNGVLYTGSVDDPLFAAHQPRTVYSPANNSTDTYYLSDIPSSVLGCKEQYQFSFARTNASEYQTDVGPLPAKINSANFPGASYLQLALLQHLVTSSVFFDMGDAKQNGLKAQAIRGDWPTNTRLPDDQWIQEIIAWETYTWAEFQVAVADYAIGASIRTPYVLGLAKNQTTPSENAICKMQKMKGPGGFVNINVFGLAFIATFSVIFTLLDLAILRFWIFLAGYKSALTPRIRRWIQDGAFQLQRRAYENNDEGTWEGLDNEIPTTVDEILLDDLPLVSRPASIDSCLTQRKPSRASHDSSASLTVVSGREHALETSQSTVKIEGWQRMSDRNE